MGNTSVYLDYAASTPLDPEIFDHMKPYLLGYAGNPSSTHQHGRQLRTAIEESRRKIAQAVNCHPHEIVFTSGGTEADNMALRGAVYALGVKNIISSPIEHHAVSHTIEVLAKEKGVNAHYLSVDSQGGINMKELESLLEDNPNCLVSLMHGNNELGNIYEIEKIAQLCQTHEALLHSDTVQTMGNVSYDLQKTPIDFLAASAHKFYGPKGIGFLFVRKGHKLPSLIYGGGQERSLRAGTENVANIVGMACALEKCMATLEEKNLKLQQAKTYMKTQLLQLIPGVMFNGFEEEGKSLPTILNVRFPGKEDAMLTFNLDIQGISSSGGSACSSGAVQGSHVLRTIGLSEVEALNSIRFSFGIYTTTEEIDICLEAIKDIVPLPASSS